MELLPREEVALLLGSLTACGFLVLGVLELVWPAKRSATPEPARAPLALPAPAQPVIVPITQPVAAAPEPPEPERPLPPPPSALSIGRMLLGRAVAEPDLERRVTILTRAVAGLTRSALAAPADEELAATLGAARVRLWQTWEEIAMARLAAAMPWGTTEPPTLAERVSPLNRAS